MASNHDGFKDFVLDQLVDLSGVRCRAMFGGYGLSHGPTFFGIIHKGRLYFKVTSTTLPQYRAHGMKPFRPNAKQTLRSFYEVPVDIIENAEQLSEWATQSMKGSPLCSEPSGPSATRRGRSRTFSRC